MEIEGLADLTPEGSGGFSQVFRATEVRYKRTVAAKVLNFRLESDTDQNRFEQECRAMAQLSDHPHIVPLYFTTYTDQGFPVIVMEYFAGGTLSQRARSGASPAELLDAGVKIASALHCAHQRGVTHRDVKPQNVLMSAFGQPALTDFGISAITQHRATTEQNKGITLAYAAPEAFDGVSNARTDVYSLGATLYTVLAGRRPFAAPDGSKQSTSELVRRIMLEEAPPLQQCGMSSEVDRTIRRLGMARDPMSRPASAREFGDLLRRLQIQEGYEPTPWIEAHETVDAGDATDNGDGLMTVVQTHHLERTPVIAAPAERAQKTSSWTARRIMALAAGAVALAALTFIFLWAGRDTLDPVAESAPTTLPTPDDFYAGPIFAPTDVTIERVGNGTAIVSWIDPNDPAVEFEIQRVDTVGRDEALIVASGTRAELPNISDSVSPCIIIRAVRDFQTSNDIDAPVCLGASFGSGPLIEVIPTSCAPASCDVQLEASGFSPDGTVSITVEDPQGRDLTALQASAYETTATVNVTGEIDWRFSPSSDAALGSYRVFVVDDQSGLSTVAFLSLVEN